MLAPGRFTVLAYSTACCACRETNANGAVVNVQAWACSFFSTGRALPSARNSFPSQHRPASETVSSDRAAVRPTEVPAFRHSAVTAPDVCPFVTRRAALRVPRQSAALVHGSRALGAPRSTSWPS